MTENESRRGVGHKKARTRQRNQARYLLRERITTHASSSSPSSPTEGIPSDYDFHTPLTHSEMDTLQIYLKAIANGNPSTFSLHVLSKQYTLFSKPFPTSFLSDYKIQTLCTSRFGLIHAQAFLQYKRTVQEITMMEYAALLGEYGIVKVFLKAGISPFAIVDQDSKNRSKWVLQQLWVDQVVPVTLVAHVAKSIYEMKMWTLGGENDGDGGKEMEEDKSCPICCKAGSTSLLVFSPQCNHSCCELCMWKSMVEQLPHRTDGNVVRCPICNQPPTGAEEDPPIPNEKPTEENRIAKRNTSLELFQGLPAHQADLKQLSGRKAKAKNVIYSTWREALAPTVGSSRDVRGDKFMRYVDMGAALSVRACLEAGVDVNMRNE